MMMAITNNDNNNNVEDENDFDIKKNVDELYTFMQKNRKRR
jgi:hypothetical protein